MSPPNPSPLAGEGGARRVAVGGCGVASRQATLPFKIMPHRRAATPHPTLSRKGRGLLRETKMSDYDLIVLSYVTA